MSSKIPILWPKEVRVDVLTPRAILLAQATGLERQTQGLLEAEVDEQEGEKYALVFDVIAPALGDARETLFKLESEIGRVYPAFVVAPCFVPAKGSLAEPAGGRQARSQQQLLEVLRDLFNASETISVLLSLIARSNEVRGLNGAANEVSPAQIEA